MVFLETGPHFEATSALSPMCVISSACKKQSFLRVLRAVHQELGTKAKSFNFYYTPPPNWSPRFHSGLLVFSIQRPAGMLVLGLSTCAVASVVLMRP